MILAAAPRPALGTHPTGGAATVGWEHAPAEWRRAPAVPDLGAGTGLEPRLVVTSARTRVDTEELAALRRTLADIADRADALTAPLDDALELSALLGTAAPARTWAAREALEDGLARARSLAVEVDALAEKVGYALLVHAAAEGDAARFHALWTEVLPHSPAVWVPASADAAAADPWVAFWTGAVGGAVRAGGVGAMGARPVFVTAVELFAARLLGAAVPVGLAFATHRGSDPVDALRAQFDMDALGGTLAGVPAGAPAGVGASRAASLAALVSVGLGRLAGGSPGTVHVRAHGAPAWAAGPGAGRGPVLLPHPSAPPSPAHGAPTLLGPWLAGSGGRRPHRPGAVPVPHPRRPTATAPVRPPLDPARAPTVPSPVRPWVSGRVIPTPHTPSEALARLSTLADGQAKGQFEILRHETPTPEGVRRSWSVIIRGTQKWGVGGSNPQDMLTNFQGVAGEESDQMRALLEGMDLAGVAPGEPVEFIGHSQGAILAAQLAADPQVAARHEVVAVLAAGGPTAGATPAPDVGVLALENTRDIVPSLDGAARTDTGAQVTVHFDGDLLGVRDPDGSPSLSHGMGTYRAAMEWMEGRVDSGDPALRDVDEWMSRRAERMGFSADTRTTSRVFDTWRGEEP